MTGMSAPRRRRLARTAGLLVVLVALGAWWFSRGGDPAPVAQVRPAAEPTPSTSVVLPSGPLDPAMFAAGSCLAMPPTKGNRGKTVFLDAGHGGPDPGGQGVTLTGKVIHERDLTLPVVLDAAALLRADGYRVVVSRSTDGPVAKLGPGDTNGKIFSVAGALKDTLARPICANLAHAAVLVSVHFNVGASPSNAGALTTYDAARSFAKENLRLADLLQNAIVSALRSHKDWNIPNDGVVTDDTVGNALSAAGNAYGHLIVLGPKKAGHVDQPSMMPGALVEPLFLTDPFEGSVADSTVGQRTIAAGIASAVQQFLNGGPAG